jgi:retinol dehydrogenase-13
MNQYKETGECLPRKLQIPPSSKTYFVQNLKLMSQQRVALVTGAAGAIGTAIARKLATQEIKVVLACRNEEKAKRTVTDIKQRTGNPNVEYVLVDLSRHHSIQALAQNWTDPLHILVNNASITPRKQEETPEGLEMQFATNILGYFWMIQEFSEILIDSAPSRVVNVASYWAGGLDLNDLQFHKRTYNNDAAYRQSKQAERMLTVAFAERFKPYGVTVNACHPGDVNSQLSNNLGFGGHESPDEGARTPVWLSTQTIELTGKYFEHQRQVPCCFSTNLSDVKNLYQTCLQFC